MADQALAAADALDERIAAGEDPGPLAGVPVALKDNLCTRGVATTCSSRILEGWTPPYDATVVERLRAAGAIAIGKTNLDEFAMGSSTENSAFGPTRNPHDTRRVPGGSSGGSAAAVAAGFAALGLGSDTGGSIRQPAALCGVVGMKPTYGRVSRYGLVAFASSLDQIGPLATTVADAAALYEAIAGHDPLDATSIPESVAPVSAHLDDGIDGLRVGLVSELVGAEGVAADVIARVHTAAEALERAGAKVEEVAVPAAVYGLSAYYLIAPAEASSNLARYDGVRYGLRVDAPTTGEMYDRTRTAGFGAEVKRRIMLGTYALSAGYYDAFYGKAQRVRTLILRDLAAAYERVDVLLSPTAPTTAFEFGAKADPLAMYLNDVCTIPSNLSGDPAISVPFGTGDDGLPVGVQVMAPALGEATMFRAARALEDGAPSECSDDGSTVVIGLEVHCELATATKLFCGCPNRFGDEPNANTCPVCLGLPGSLPVLNAQAVELALRLGRALGCEVRTSVFARKNYFYPDMPKDYQITQYDLPTNVNGVLALPSGKPIGIERAHIEEDTGKSIHVGGGGRIHDAGYSLVDYNRSGVPLVEIVSRPDLTDSDEAKAYVSELRAILLATGASDAKMEEGSLRVDANVSVHRPGEPYGTRCEIKNVNSLRSLARAIEYEARRQIELLEAGEIVQQETRHWDEATGRTGTLRSKEEAEDYRYFPEPDLVPLAPDDDWIARVDASLPALPAARRTALATAAEVESSLGAVAVAVERGLDELALAAIAAGADPGRLLTHIEHNLAVEGATDLDPDHLAELVRMETAGELTATQAKQVLAEMIESGRPPGEIATARGFEAMDTGALEKVVDEVIAAHPDEWEKFRSRRRQGARQAHRLLRRPCHAGHQGPSRRQGRHRPSTPTRPAVATTQQADSR